jgi:NAD kinase
MLKTRFDKITVVTRKTELEELIERFNTREQARFYIEHMGGSFEEYDAAHSVYHEAVETLKAALPPRFRSQWIERAFLPTFTFDAHDLIVTLGPDGLVVNTAKYLDGQPLLAFNPDDARVDGVLVPFGVAEAASAIDQAMALELQPSPITMARATLNDGQTLDAVNDLFIGQKTHVSARYLIRHKGNEERQSSSGVIVSTGAGSTGWLRSVLAGAAGVVKMRTEAKDDSPWRDDYRFDPSADALVYSVREPFPSKVSAASMIHGKIHRKDSIEIVSQMPRNGVIFSDGVEEDHLEFNSGAIATIGISPRKLMLFSRADTPSPEEGVTHTHQWPGSPVRRRR